MDDKCQDGLLKRLDQFKKSSSFACWDKGNISGKEWLKTIEHNYNPNYIFVGLNPSRNKASDPDSDWMSFHDDGPKSKDEVLCHALTGTEYERAFLTDLYYDVYEPDSNNVLNKRKQTDEDYFRCLFNARRMLGGQAVIVAMHSLVFKRLTSKTILKGINDADLLNEISSVPIKHITHYSFRYVNKETYRAMALIQLGNHIIVPK